MLHHRQHIFWEKKQDFSSFSAEFNFEEGLLTHETPKFLSHKIQLIDFQSRSIDWFLYGDYFGV